MCFLILEYTEGGPFFQKLLRHKPSKSFSKRFALLVALNIKTINLKIGVMSPPGRHPGLIEWILEESSTGVRQTLCLKRRSLNIVLYI